ncbi:MAG: amidohydrolase family protein [Rhodospirillaceae bacterium]|nr:amidohydrolase family protein [Rhodospirillaceae bacterium]
MRHLNMTAAIAIAAAMGMAAPACAQNLVFEGGRVIVGDGSAPIENATVVVEGGKITQVGPAAGVKAPAGATRVDAKGKTIMPTLIDTHVHLSQTKDGIDADMKRRAYFGISAAMSMGVDNTEPPHQYRLAQPAASPRYFYAGRGITRPEPGRGGEAYWIDTAAEGVKAVDEQATRNVDLIKIWVDDRDEKYKKLTPELYGPIIEEAHKKNLRVTAHIFDVVDAKGLLKAGIDAFAHLPRDTDVDDEFMTLLKAKKGFVQNPNMGARGAVADVSWLKAALPAAEYAKVEEGNKANPQTAAGHAIQARNLKKISDAGTTIVMGTDGNTPYAPHFEMEDMALAGMSNMKVLVAATGDAAKFLRIPDAGTIAVGKTADILVLDANPVDDIKNTRKINAVYLKGVAVDRKAYP